MSFKQLLGFKGILYAQMPAWSSSVDLRAKMSVLYKAQESPTLMFVPLLHAPLLMNMLQHLLNLASVLCL